MNLSSKVAIVVLVVMVLIYYIVINDILKRVTKLEKKLEDSETGYEVRRISNDVADLKQKQVRDREHLDQMIELGDYKLEGRVELSYYGRGNYKLLDAVVKKTSTDSLIEMYEESIEELKNKQYEEDF